MVLDNACSSKQNKAIRMPEQREIRVYLLSGFTSQCNANRIADRVPEDLEGSRIPRDIVKRFRH